MTDNIRNKIDADVKTAMRNREKVRLATLRLILAAFKQKEVDERAELDDAQRIAILGKMVKQHQDSIEQFQKANRIDLVEKEKNELDIIQVYLPTRLTDDEIEREIEQAIAKTGATSIKDMGQVMHLLKTRLQGRADMGSVSRRIQSRLNDSP